MYLASLNHQLEGQKFLAIMLGADPEAIKSLRYDLNTENLKQVDLTEKALSALGITAQNANASGQYDR